VASYAYGGGGGRNGSRRIEVANQKQACGNINIYININGPMKIVRPRTDNYSRI
jgi:hypothetical protein